MPVLAVGFTGGFTIGFTSTTWGRVPVLCRKNAADHDRWENYANDVH